MHCPPEFITKLKDDSGSLLVWIDYMKLGRVNNADLNNTVDLCKRALASMPERSCCFAIAPQLVSDKRPNIKAEWR